MPKKSPRAAASTSSKTTPSPEQILEESTQLLPADQKTEALKAWPAIVDALAKTDVTKIRAVIMTVIVDHEEPDEDTNVRILNFVCGNGQDLAGAAIIANKALARGFHSINEYAEDEAAPHVRH